MTSELKGIVKELEVAIKKFEELPSEITERDSIVKHLRLAWIEVVQAKKEFLELKNTTTSG